MLNLIDDVSLTTDMLLDPLAWRVRAVDEITVDTATSCLRKRSLQVAPLRDTGLLAGSAIQVVGDSDSALLVVPLASVPRGPLLDFDIDGPLGDGWLLPRLEIARREALYVAALAEWAGIGFSSHVVDVLEALVGFADGSLRRVDGSSRDLEDFLVAGTGMVFDASTLGRLRLLSQRCRWALDPHDARPHDVTAPKTPARALPSMLASGVVTSLDEGLTRLDDYTTFLRQLERTAETTNEAGVVAQRALAQVGAYGRSFDLMVAVRVPLDEPFTIKFSERRNSKIRGWRQAGSQLVNTADALTNHVTFKVTDPNVRIASFRATKPISSTQYSDGAVVGRRDSQTRSLYLYDEDRDPIAVLRFRLALLRRLQFVPYLVGVFVAAAGLALLVVDFANLRDTALLAGPAAIAASVLVTRELSTLGSRLRIASSALLNLGLVLVVLGVIANVLR